MFHVNLQGCTLISHGIHVYLDTYIYHKNHPYPLEIYIPVPWIENVIGKTIGDTLGMGGPFNNQPHEYTVCSGYLLGIIPQKRIDDFKTILPGIRPLFRGELLDFGGVFGWRFDSG